MMLPQPHMPLMISTGPPASLGPHWTGISDGGLSISSHAVTGRSGLTGDIWTARTFTSNQYSQIEVTSTQLTGGQWIGTAVRAQHGGRDAYVGIYYWNNGKPELMLFKRSGEDWTQLGSYSSGPLAAGTKLKLVAVGNYDLVPGERFPVSHRLRP